MSTFRHPVWDDITTTVPDERDDEAWAAGWIPDETTEVRAGGRAEPIRAHLTPRPRRRGH